MNNLKVSTIVSLALQHTNIEKIKNKMTQVVIKRNTQKEKKRKEKKRKKDPYQ